MFHKKFTFLEDRRIGLEPIYSLPEFSIDEAVSRLIADNRMNKEAIMRLIKEIEAIHAHYRSELCNDCCHSEVCKLRPNVKYGFECEDKAYELEVELFEVEPEKVETEKEEANEGL